MAEQSAAPTGTETPKRGFLQNLLDLYVSPGQTFADVTARPRFLLPLLGLIVLNVAFTAVWLQKVDAREFFKAQDEQSSRWADMSAEQRTQMIETQTKMLPIFGWVGAVLGAPLFVVVVSAVYLFVFRFFLSGDVRFAQSLSVVTHSLLAVGIVTTTLTLATLALKGDWDLNPQEALQANLSLVLDRETAPKALYSLAQSIDLFTFWIMGLMSVGYGVASRRSVSSAAWGVLSVWAVWVLGKVAMVAIFA